MYELTLTIPGLPATTNKIGKEHWGAKSREARSWQRLVRAHVGTKYPKEPLKKAKLTLVRHSSRPLDFDNLAISFKHVVDGLRYAKVILDDKWSVIGMPELRWERAPALQGFIFVKVEEA